MQKNHVGAVHGRELPARRRARRADLEVLERRELLATFLVQNVSDDANAGSLRWAIQQANADSDPTSVINFAIGGAGVKTIALGSALPAVTHPTVINGTSQGNYAGTPLIELDGSALKSSDSVLTITAGKSTVKALTINGCPGVAITLQGKGAGVGDGNTVVGCFIGTSATGAAAKANGLGIAISGSSNNIIGGTGTNAGNVIAGNLHDGIDATSAGSSHEVIQGNLIGASRIATGAGLNLRAGFDGLQFNDTRFGSTPPDTITAVGQSNVLETVNEVLRISGKDGKTVSTTQLGAFFPNSVAADLFDPVVFYDDIARRFVVAAMENPSKTSTSFLDIAFSDVGNETSFTAKYRLDVQANNNWADFPRFGFNADAVVLTFNMYNASGTAFNGVQILSIDKSSIGATSLNTVKLDRPTDFTDAPASMHGAVPGQPLYFVEADPLGSGSHANVHILTWSNPLSGSSALTDSVVTVPTYLTPTNAAQLGSTNLIQTNDTRMLSVAWRNNRLVATHQINNSANDPNARWYEFFTDPGNPQSTPALTQSGEINQGAGVATYFPSIDIDGKGNLGMTFMESSATEYMSMYVTGQLVGAAPGTMLAPVLARAGVAAYVAFDTPPYRAGDFSGAGVDPTDGTFWTANEYAIAGQTGANWGTWVQQFSLQASSGFSYIALGNGSNGIFINGPTNVLIGGTTPAAANIIGANGGDGILAQGGSSGLAIQGNYIGTDPAGDLSLSNKGNGVSLSTTQTTIGGTASGAMNVISGNALAGISTSQVSGALIQGNHIGVGIDGITAIPNAGDGIQIISSSAVSIGGTATGAANVISGNKSNGIELAAAFVQPNTSNTLIEGNLIGLDGSGLVAVPNGSHGIFQNGGDRTTIGGTAGGARNIISGNSSDGISMGTGDHSLVEGNYIGTDITGKLAVGNRIGLEWTNASYATIGGTSAAARNIISGNTSAGINSFVIGSSHEVIQGNFIGVDATGAKPLPNNGVGMRISGPTDNTIGGTVPGAANVISGNSGNGIEFTVGPANGTVVQGNFIGTDASGTLNLGNDGTGIVVWSDDVTIGGTAQGAGNVIAYNKGRVLDQGDGIRLVFNVHHNSFLSNSIHDNAGLGINFGNGPTPNHPDEVGAVPGPNDFQNYPVITSAVSTGGNTVISGTLNAGASTDYLVQLFSNATQDPSGFGEGQTYLGSVKVTTNGSNNGSFNVTLSGVTVPGGSFISATATDPSGNTSEFSKNLQTVVIADVGITGSAAPSPAFVGDTLTYTFTVTNGGPDPAHNVVFSDTLPLELIYAGNFGSTPSGVVPVVNGQSITANLPTIAANTSIILTFQATTLAGAIPKVSNTANVTTTDQDPDTTNNTVTVTTTVQPVADLALSALTTAPAAPNYAGKNLVYTVTATNNGLSNATGVTLVDTLPSNVTFVSASGGVTPVGGKLTFNVGNLAVGASVTYTITVTPTAAATASPLVNTATVNGAEHDGDMTNNSRSLSTTITPSADLNVSITASPSPVLAGQTVTYTVTATNNGPSDATGVVINDTIPADVTFVSASNGVKPDANHKLVFAIGNLAAGASSSVQITVGTTAATATPTTSAAGVAGGQFDPNLPDNTATARVTVTPVSDLGVGMTGPAAAHVGDVVTYTITAANNGPSAGPSSVVTDTLPANVTFQSAVCSIFGVTPLVVGNQVITNLGTLKVGDSPTITIKVLALPGSVGNLVNMATIKGQNADTTPANDTATATTVISASADLAVTLTGAATGLVGQNLVYTVNVTNNGLSDATGVTLVDILPANVTFVSSSDPTVSPVGGTLTFNVGNLVAKATATYIITVSPLQAAVGTPVVNSASVSGKEFDPDLANNSAPTSTTVSPAVDLAITQFTAAPEPILVGSNLAYTVVVTNKGPSPATNVTITSPLAKGVTYVANSGTAQPSGTVGQQGTNVVASLGELAPGATATVTFAVTPGVFGPLTAAVTAAATEADTDPSNSTSTVTSTVLDLIGTIEFSAAAYSVPENAGSAAITVNRVNGARGTILVDYATAPINAVPGFDYTPVSGTLTFADGVTSQTIVVPVLANPYDNTNKLVNVILSNIQSATTPGQPILGTPSTATLTIQDLDPDYRPLIVSNMQWTGTAQDIRQVFVTFNKPLVASTAVNPSNYALVNVGQDGRYGTLDDLGVALNAPTYDSASFTVTLTPSASLSANRFFHLMINAATPGGVEDLGANMLSGNGTTPGTDYTALFARGTSLKYFTPVNDQVSLQIKGGGILDDLLDGAGQGRKLSVVGEIPHRTVLTGSVRKASGGAGQAYLGQTIWGLGRFGDVRVKMYSPPFRVDYYPFSPGSAAATTAPAGVLVRLDGSVVKTPGKPVVVTSSASRTGTARSSRTMNRPFHQFSH